MLFQDPKLQKAERDLPIHDPLAVDDRGLSLPEEDILKETVEIRRANTPCPLSEDEPHALLDFRDRRAPVPYPPREELREAFPCNIGVDQGGEHIPGAIGPPEALLL